jgi:hypothetical protein
MEYWSDLPDDLLRLVYTKVGSLLHRVRFSAVCRSWQAAAVALRHAAPPALPWLIFSSRHWDGYRTRHVYCPEEDAVMRILLPGGNVLGKLFVGAQDGGWIAAVGQHNLQLAIVNLFSGVEVKRWTMHVRNVRKVVFSESPSSSGCILAAITKQHDILLCRLGCPDCGWTTKQFHLEGVRDIIFHNGNLYCLNLYEDLVRFEIGVNQVGWPMITKQHLQAVQMRNSLGVKNDPCYIFELKGKLAMAVRNEPSTIFRSEPFFQVFELADEPAIGYVQSWKEVVTNLGDYSLFLGKTWSKAVHVPAGGRGGVKRNHIYADNVLGAHNYLMQENGGDEIISAESSILPRPWGETWILPPNF